MSQPNIENIHQEISKNNNYSVETPMRETYDSLCRMENQNGIYFPNKSVEYAKLTKNGIWKTSELIKGDELKELLEFLNDSSSYGWGEIGTSEIHYFLTYYDQNDLSIGLTTIDLKGMAYSYPSTARMKWGLLKEMKLIDKLIFE